MRAKKVKSEEALIKDIIKSQKQLLKYHNTASLFSYRSKVGQVQTGSNHVVEKFRNDFEHDANWIEAFEADDDELVNGQQQHDDEEDELNGARSSILPEKLMAPVNLLKYSELWAWLTNEILKEYWSKGGKLRCVKFGHRDFEPSFWLGNIWPWSSVYKHPKDLRKEDYEGPGTLTEYLKDVVRNRLDMLGINPEMWVTEKFGEKERKKRERNRKKNEPIPVEVNVDIIEEEGEHRGDEANTSLNGNDHASGEQNQNDENDIQTDDTLENIHDLVENNDVDINNYSMASNISNVDGGFATSTIQRRRHSARQAAKRARLDASLPSIDENVIPPIPRKPATPPSTSAASAPRSQPSPSPGPSSAQQATPPRFVPRRRPLYNGNSNFHSPLYVNVGKEHSAGQITNIHVPTDLVTKFEELAQENTNKGLETGGILAGKLVGNHYDITHVIIPHQTAADDRFDVQDVRQLANVFCVQPDLVMLGLIHTHPKWDSFLSSVDIHALWDYAKDNPSLISIVLAPKKNTAPAYCLTSLGFREISQCKEKGFHKHRIDDKKLYHVAEHVFQGRGLVTTVIDQRFSNK